MPNNKEWSEKFKGWPEEILKAFEEEKRLAYEEGRRVGIETVIKKATEIIKEMKVGLDEKNGAITSLIFLGQSDWDWNIENPLEPQASSALELLKDKK